MSIFTCDDVIKTMPLPYASIYIKGSCLLPQFVGLPLSSTDHAKNPKNLKRKEDKQKGKCS